jgi:hypothetical protein
MPTQFEAIGRKTRGLLQKKYVFEHRVKTAHNASDGLRIETGFSATTAPAQGFVRASFQRDGDRLQAEVSSNAEAGDKFKLRAGKLVRNVALSLNASSAGNVGARATISRGLVGAIVDVQHADEKTTAKISGAYEATKSLVVGGCADVDVTGGNINILDYHAGVQYRYQNWLPAVTAKHNNNTNQLSATVSLYHKLSEDLQWGTSVLWQNTKPPPVLSLALLHKLSPVTTIKSRGDSNGILAFVVQHRLKDPRVKFTLATEFDVKKSVHAPARKFGLSLVFGDF